MRLDGKVAIVTGGASGIGAATSRLFAQQGMAGVVVTDTNESLGQSVADAINADGGRAIFAPLDVIDEARWIEIVSLAEATFGRLDVTVNNAGMPSRKMVEDTSVEEWDRAHAVNGTGVFLGTKHSIAPMRKVGGGSIVNISSIYGIIGSAKSAAYHSSKGAVRAFTKAAAVQYAAENIRVNSVHPGFVDSAMTANAHADPMERERRLKATPMGRMGKPEDIAWACIYLAADQSGYVTGSELVVDGGVTAQ